MHNITTSNLVLETMFDVDIISSRIGYARDNITEMDPVYLHWFAYMGPVEVGL